MKENIKESERAAVEALKRTLNMNLEEGVDIRLTYGQTPDTAFGERIAAFEVQAQRRRERMERYKVVMGLTKRIGANRQVLFVGQFRDGQGQA